MRTAQLRLRSVKFKDGRAPLRIFHQPEPEAQGYTEKEVLDFCREACELQTAESDIIGYAIVVWGTDGGVTPSCRTLPGSPVPPMLIGEFVANSLRAERVRMWLEDA